MSLNSYSKYILVALFVFTAQALKAQTLLVKDSISRLPISGVSIASSAGTNLYITNAEGKVILNALKDATKISFQAAGYQTLIKDYAWLEKNNFTVYLSPSETSLDIVTITANKWAQTTSEVPNKVSKISAKEVAFQNPQTVADLLAISGEVFIQKSQLGGGSPMIRGFATNRVLLVVDGVRMNTAIFRSGNLQNVISLDAFILENTEVLFGPGSVMYGSDAIGGVMHFQTLSPQFSTSHKPSIKGEAVLRYATANQERTGHSHINIGTEKWALLSSISHSDFDDLRMGRFGPDDYLRNFYVQRQNGADVVVQNENPLIQRPTAYSQTNLMQKIRFQPNTNWDFQYGLHYSATSSYARYDRLTLLRNNLPRSAEWNYGSQIWLMNHLSIKHKKSNTLYDFATLNVAHQLFEESRIDRNFNQTTRRIRLEKVNALSINLDFNKSIGNNKSLFYGLEWVNNQVNSTGFDENILLQSREDAQARYPMSSWASYAAYFTYQWQLSEKLVLQLASRYNAFSLQSNFENNTLELPYERADLRKGALTGSIGFTYQPKQNTLLRANLSTGFRSPNVDDIGKLFDSNPGLVIVPNPALQAEYAYNAEVGLVKQFANYFTFEASAYYTYLDNALVRRDFTLNGQDSILYAGTLSRVQALQNAANAKVYGFQAGLEMKLPNGISIHNRFNYQQGTEELDNDTQSSLRHVAPIFGVSSLRYQYQTLLLDFFVMYNGAIPFEKLSEEGRNSPHLFAKDTNGNPHSPAWLTLNLKASYTLKQGWQINAGLENITNRRYRPYSSGIAAAGRNFILSLRRIF